MGAETTVTVEKARATSGKPRTTSWQLKEMLTAWIFSLPAFLLLLVFLIIPFFMAIYFSFTNQTLIPGPIPTEFVGFRNFARLLQDNTFYHALLNNFLFGIIVVPVQTTFALSLAILANQKIRGIYVFRTIYFSPVVTTIAVISVVWSFLYNPDQGLINHFLKSISFGHIPNLQWLNDVHLALPAIIIMSIWQGVGFQMLIYLAGLQGIPDSLYEAARVDGAGRWKQFLNVTLPQLRNTTIFVVIATTILAFKLYTQVAIMTQGGPENATITSVYYLVQQGFSELHVGYASAIAVIFFLIVLVISILQRTIIKEEGQG